MADIDFTKAMITGSHDVRMGTLNALVNLYKQFKMTPPGFGFDTKSKQAIQNQIHQMFRGVMSGKVPVDEARKFLHRAVTSLIETRRRINLFQPRPQPKSTLPGLRVIAPETASIHQPSKGIFVGKVQPTKQNLPFISLEVPTVKKDVTPSKSIAKTTEPTGGGAVNPSKQVTPKGKEVAEVPKKTTPAPTNKPGQTKDKGVPKGAPGGGKTEKASTFDLSALWENISKGLGTYKWGILGLLAGLLLMSFLRGR